MNKIYDNGTMLIGNVKMIKDMIKNNLEKGSIDDLDLITEILEDIKDLEDNTIICLNYDNPMGYSYDYWDEEDIVKECE